MDSMTMNHLKLNTAAYRNFLNSEPLLYAEIWQDTKDIFVKISDNAKRPAIKKGFIPLTDLEITDKYFKVRMPEDGLLMISPTAEKPSSIFPSGMVTFKKPEEPTQVIPEETPEPEVYRSVPVDLETMFEMNVGNEVQTWREERSKRWENTQENFMAMFSTLPQVFEEEPLTQKRCIEKVINVPVSFDHRRGLGQRSVAVTVKRRKLCKH
jgi:hypothetical protein